METRICVVGLGYVGLPLAIALSKSYTTMGFDLNKNKIEALRKHKDPAGELSEAEIKGAKVEYTSEAASIGKCNFIIVAVPTPITAAKVPDLSMIESASRIVGQNIKKGSTVVFESTVYPGVTEDICAPIIEIESGLSLGKDWKIGYSPERINPGDKEHTIDRITKVVSGMDQESLDLIAQVYSSFTNVFKAQSIKVAEAAKVIENIQRDLNIALMNELSMIFRRMDIDLRRVLEAAGTKWNFHKYTPGLVGGHCIGVDPYYLTYRAQERGYNPQVILAGRQVNDSMAAHVAQLAVKELNNLGKAARGSRILVVGLTFKENVKDARNSKAKDLIAELKEYGVEVMAHDPALTQDDIDQEGFGVVNMELEMAMDLDAVIVTVPHNGLSRAEKYEKLFKDHKLLIDIKGTIPVPEGFIYVRL